MSLELEGKTKRHFEIDVARAFVIIIMVLDHVYQIMCKSFNYDSLPTGVFRNVMEFLGGPVGAPVFMFSMGVCMIFTRHNSPGEFMKRGLRLLIAGYVLNFFCFTVILLIANALGEGSYDEYTPLESFLVVDILHFAGLSFLLVGFLKKFCIHPLWIFCIALLMQAVAIWGIPTEINRNPINMLLGLLLYSSDTAAFSLMHWFVYPAAGMVFGIILQKINNKKEFYLKVFGISVASLLLVISNFIWIKYDIRNIYTISNDILYKQNMSHIVFTMPIILLLYSLAYFMLNSFEQTRLGRFIKYCSANLNSIYVFQWVLITYMYIIMSAYDIIPLDNVGTVLVGAIFLFISILLSFIWNCVCKKYGKISTFYPFFIPFWKAPTSDMPKNKGYFLFLYF